MAQQSVELNQRLAEIEQLLIDYSTAIDRRQFNDLDLVFASTPISTSRLSKGMCALHRLSLRP